MRRSSIIAIGAVAFLGFVAACSGPSYMPSVAGMERDEIIALAEDIGLQAEFETSFSNGVPEGQAIESDPAAGAEISGLDSVLVTMSRGPEPDPEPEPEPEPVFDDWAPEGYYEVTDNIAFRWADATGDPCGGAPCRFWRAEVVTRTGCPSSVYAEINILRGNSVIDWTNSTLSSLGPDQVGNLTFTLYGYGNSPGDGLTAELSQLSCR